MRRRLAVCLAGLLVVAACGGDPAGDGGEELTGSDQAQQPPGASAPAPTPQGPADAPANRAGLPVAPDFTVTLEGSGTPFTLSAETKPVVMMFWWDQ